MVGSGSTSSPKKASPAKKAKQTQLFSFFSKKPTSTASTKPKPKSNANANANTDAKKPKAKSNVPPLMQSSSSSSSGSDVRSQKKQTKTTINKSRSKQDELLAAVRVGSKLSVYWPNDKEYYTARVTSKKRVPSGNGTSNVVTLLYDDGEVENLDLTNESFKILSDSDAHTQSQGPAVSQVSDESVSDKSQDESKADPSRQSKAQRSSSGKKRLILEDSDEEFEFEDDAGDGDNDNDDESDFEAPDDEQEDDEEFEDVDMADEDDEQEDDRKKSAKPKSFKRLRVSSVKSPLPTSNKKQRHDASVGGFVTPPPSSKARTSNTFASFASDSSVKKQAKAVPNVTQSPMADKTQMSPLTSPMPSVATAPAKIPLPQAGVVNAPGTHYHNHFKFLHPDKIRDGQGRPASHPEYDPRTLKVDYGEMERVMKNKLTPAAKQWWEIKAKYADTILLFKTGKFYEIFHMDSDISVQVLGFQYMKGVLAHTGFPEISYGMFCERLVKAGYKVARVEQTETPDMLKERKKNTRKGVEKPKVVNREVCSIVSAGTRTFCYMDDVRDLENDNVHNGIGPLLVIKEITFSAEESNDGNDDSVKPVCEYGITLVDAATGIITLGQFADDVLRSRMNTLLTKYRPSEILVENGSSGASGTLLSLLKSVKNTFLPSCAIGKVNVTESFPSSTAIDANDRAKMQRATSRIHPWDNEETIKELHRRGYYPRASRKSTSDDSDSINRWPDVLKACINGGADLAVSSFGAALFYLQRSLIDGEILSMGVVRAYIPPDPAAVSAHREETSSSFTQLASHEQRVEDGVDHEMGEGEKNTDDGPFSSQETSVSSESAINHLSLDGTTIANLELLTNLHSNTVSGSLWSKINYTKSPFGSRLLRAWLLRPLFRKTDIDRRADAVEELISGNLATAMSEARDVLGKCGDMERLLSRVHSMGGNHNNDGGGHHPNDRAVLYESVTHTKRKVGDFSKLLDGLKAVSQIPEIFDGIDIRSGLLQRIVRTTDNGGLFPSKLNDHLDWFFDNFDCNKAAKGLFEPSRGIDEGYDAACDEIESIKSELEDYKNIMCSEHLKPSHVAKRAWKYANIKMDSKDKYLIELPINVDVPANFIVKGKRGKGQKQVNKYRTPMVEALVERLEQAYDVVKEGKARGMQLVFSKFDSMRSVWASAAQASAMIDALGSLAKASSKAGYIRPVIAECPEDTKPSINVVQGRHPCVDTTHSGGDFIPNDLALGGGHGEELLLMVSGPNMGGKSTLLRQTCLIAVLAQIGMFVPAEECTLTPFDRIFTRLGASDRILMGQSTFFVELAETAAALRGATRRSLVIMDELGRGTSTFDGTAIAHATVRHLVGRNRCLSLFATHYHSLLEDWKDDEVVRLGHMECFVEENESTEKPDEDENRDKNITFLYTLGEGSCPKSFGINVARLAGLPEDVLNKAKQVSESFEAVMNDGTDPSQPSDSDLRDEVAVAMEGDWSSVERIWERLQKD